MRILTLATNKDVEGSWKHGPFAFSTYLKEDGNMNKPVCEHTECFRNSDGMHCDLLTSRTQGPCHFRKTVSKNDNDQIAAHNRLVRYGKFDLIWKYEFNAQRKGQW